MSESQQQREALLKQHEIQTLANKIFAPTIDLDVKRKLRQLGEPITLFGEGPGERRTRLKLLIARLTIENPGLNLVEAGEQMQEEVSEEEAEEEEEANQAKPKELFFTSGPASLKEARIFVAKYSLPRAQKRIEDQKKLYENVMRNEQFDIIEDVKKKKEVSQKLKKFANVASQVGDQRPLSAICAYSLHNHSKYKTITVTGGFTGVIKAWSAPDCKQITTFKGHEERVTGLAFNPNPEASALVIPETMNEDQTFTTAFASASADGTAKLWALGKQTPLDTLKGHTNRLCRLAFHPSGRFIGTTSFDGTWRLWDIAMKECVLEQEGHSRGVYAIAFQSDGALAATSDLGGNIRVWDLRSGRTLLPLTGHVKQVLALDFSPNGYHLASSSDDNTVKIWDLRKKKSIYSVPAHSKLVSSVKYEPKYGRYFVTSSYDNTVKIWRSLEYKLVKTLKGHDNYVTSADIIKGDDDNDMIFSASFDRSWKVWAYDASLDI